MDQVPFVVSFYTPKYSGEADRLRASLLRWPVPHVLVPMECSGAWETNCSRKSAFVCDMLSGKHRLVPRGHPVLWLDADAEVLAPLSGLFGLVAGSDFAAFLPGLPGSPWGPSRFPLIGSRLVSSVLYFSGSFQSLAFAAEWASGCAAAPFVWDQEVLFDTLVSRPRPELGVCPLPPEFVAIPDLMPGLGAPVILQHQASRRLKV